MVALRLVVIAALGLLGLAGLLDLPLEPPLGRRNGTGSDRMLAELEHQEALQDSRERAAISLDRFVGGQITRFVWGGFTPYLDVIGLEPPDDMTARVVSGPGSIELRLAPSEGGGERYIGRVEGVNNAPRAVSCRGEGTPGPFALRAGRLQCPEGWIELRTPERRQRRG
ncbi:hypothetical protein [Cyanobium sp. Morenito 9A2]|uniref:hypothetical protein n=1 Tax=Cyanobium sp. Morenito 9A2 TaxID=2823718 RepID=UPI0020CC1E0B|nr:hypothetical protein [Cyanobium sp. Morenito 9A2]